MVVVCGLSVVGCWLLFGVRSLCVVCCVLLVGWCLSFVVWWLPVVVCCSVFGVRC